MVTYPLKYKATCKNLLKCYDFDELSALIASGNFNDINIGDYMEVEMTTNLGTTESPNNVTEKVRWLVADIDYFLHTGDTPLETHHLVLLPEDSFKTTAKMNNSNTTSGAYANSVMWKTTIPKYDTAIETAFGSSHVLTYRQLLSNSMSSGVSPTAVPGSSGASNNWNWYDCKLSLMNEVMVYGSNSFSISCYDVGINKKQFKLFKQMPELMHTGLGINGSTSSRSNYWLSSVASSASFCRVNYYGYSTSSTASNSFGVRPFFLFI